MPIDHPLSPPTAQLQASVSPTAQRRANRAASCAIALSLLSNHAVAQNAPAAGASPGQPGFAAALLAPARTTILGDLWGVRSTLAAAGGTLSVLDSSEILGNATGGNHRGAAGDSAIQLTLGLDLQNAIGWAGATVNISAYQLNGRNLSADNLATLQTASGIEGSRATRLWESWLQQGFLGGRLTIRAGQQSIDQEFIVSAGSSLFVNTAMGWPLLPSADLYAGAPAYPLASLGVRLAMQPASGWSLLAALYDDNPAGGSSFTDATQLRGATQSGTEFNLGTGALAIAELQYACNPFASGPDPAITLPGLYKIGGWYDTGAFPDQRYGASGTLLAGSDKPGTARSHGGNWSLYAVFDQAVWRPDPAATRTLAVFTRVMAAPSDRNLISSSLNGGITLKQPLPGRDNDMLGIGFGLGTISAGAAGLDADTASHDHRRTPIRSREAFIEITYQAQLLPWISLQPDFQYTIAPGGGLAALAGAGRRIGDEVVFGIRTVMAL